MEITEKVAYLKGLMEGLAIDNTTKEGKVFSSIVDILGDIATEISDLEAGVSVVAQQVDMLDEDLAELQEDVYDEDEDDCCCGHHHHDDDDEIFDGELYEVTCPTCGDTVCIDEDMLDEGEIDCPGCGETLEFDLDGVLDGLDVGQDSEDK